MKVQRGHTYDGLGKYYREMVTESELEPVDVQPPAARVEARASGLALECWTTAPGVQVYDANQLAPTDPPGRRGADPHPLG